MKIPEVILSMLREQSMSAKEITERTGFVRTTVNSTLSAMERRGDISSDGGFPRVYSARNMTGLLCVPWLNRQTPKFSRELLRVTHRCGGDE